MKTVRLVNGALRRMTNGDAQHLVDAAKAQYAPKSAFKGWAATLEDNMKAKVLADAAEAGAKATSASLAIDDTQRKERR